MRWLHFRPRWLGHRRYGDGRCNPPQAGSEKVPTDGCRDRGFGASRGPAEKIIGPRQAGWKCDGCIFGRDGWGIVDTGMDAVTRHKLDQKRSLWTVVVIGVLEPREDPPKK